MLQFCWLSPDKRATAEEVHRLLTYLRMQGQKDMEEDFEQRWDALKPNPTTRQTTVSHSSFPILDQFAEDALRPEIDEVLTVTETSRGLSFEYVWEAAKHDHYDNNHGRSAMDTTLNYHSMFFPVSSEDIQAHFPDPATRTGGTETGSTPSGIPGILPVFDAQKPSNGNEYYIQLEEQGESTVGGTENRGSDFDTTSGRQQFVVLQDVRLDESSTDADFFHQSIDSKDSFLPDSHIWSSLENDSPYHTNIFSDGDSKQEDTPSWRRSFMELPERNGNSLQQSASLESHELDTEKNLGDSFLGLRSEATRLEERDNADVKRLLNTEKLCDNFLFLKEKSLMKDDSSLSGKSKSLPQNFLSPGLAHVPEESFKMSSWDNLENLDRLNIAETHLKPVASSISPRVELVDFSSPILGDFRQPLVENKTLVPSITLVTEEFSDNQLPVRNSSSSEDIGPLHSSDTGIDTALDSTSERIEVPGSITSSNQSPTLSESATSDSLCTDAKFPSLEEDLGTSKDSVQPVRIDEPFDFKVHASPPDSSHSEGLMSNDPFSELMDDAEVEIETALSDHEESIVDDDGIPPAMSSLLVSGPSMDQISQDSLLEDSVSTTLPTVDNSAGTPDSLDSLDIHRLEAQVEELSFPGAPHKLQPPYKIADSGYETENLESPEWNSQPIDTDHSLVENGTSVVEEEETGEPIATTILVTPEIIVSEVESGLNVQDEENEEDQEPEPIAPGEEPFMGGNYRDSAYFSDNESEPEKKSEETNMGSSAEVSWLRNSSDEASGATGAPSAEVSVEGVLDSSVSQQESHVVPEALVHVNETPVPQDGSILPELVLTTEENSETEMPESIDNHKEDGDKLEFFSYFSSSAQPEPSQPSEDLETSTPPPATSAKLPENMVHAKLTRTYAGDSPKIKEPDMEGRYLGRRDSSGSDGQEDGMDADEEDENSDDSDDDMRAYRLHSSSEDSDDDTVHPVPIIISDDRSAKNLKSLLKPTTLDIAARPSLSPAGGDADNSRRAVSFFDDVTVYLFDQVQYCLC